MGAAKNIFGAFTSVFDTAKKGIKSVVKRAPTKSLSSPVISTTSKTLGTSRKLVSGGQSVTRAAASKFAKGVGSTANVGGKVFGVTGIIGGVSLASAKVYDYIGDTWAITTAQREYERQIKLAGQEVDVTKKAQENQLDYMQRLMNLRNEGQDPNVLGSSGGAGFPSDLFPMGAAAAAKDSGSNALLYALIGVALIGGGAYIYKKKGRKK